MAENLSGDAPRSEALIGRRELLVGGALLTAGGCRVSSAAPMEGGFVGAGHHLGHLLREPGRLPPPAGSELADVVIVGAGVAGLAAAWHLARAGVRDLTVLELEDSPGGNARAGAAATTAYPWGAHYLPLPGAEARGVRALLREVGVIEAFGREGRPVYDERHLCHAPQERLYHRGRWHDGLFPSAGAAAQDRAQLEAFRRAMDGYRGWRLRKRRTAGAAPR